MRRNFLSRIFDEDEQLIGFVQRMLGYCLTGITREHAMFFLWPGRQRQERPARHRDRHSR
jgi:phage/plasmid-associated DNA primase